MKKTYNLSELIINDEKSDYINSERLEKEPTKIREVNNKGGVRHITWIDSSKDIKSVKTPDGRELTPEELFDFVIGNNMNWLRNEVKEEDKADVAIVLGCADLKISRERALKAIELYRRGIVKKIIFTGGAVGERGDKFNKHEGNEVIDLAMEDLPEADVGALVITDEMLEEFGIDPADVVIEYMSTTTQQNAEFCENIFDEMKIETGEEVKTALIVSTVTHCNRASKQFGKVFGNKIALRCCSATKDLEKYPSLLERLEDPEFDEKGFMKELKRTYCESPELVQKLREEIGHHRNVFIRGEIYEPTIECEEKGTFMNRIVEKIVNYFKERKAKKEERLMLSEGKYLSPLYKRALATAEKISDEDAIKSAIGEKQGYDRAKAVGEEVRKLLAEHGFYMSFGEYPSFEVDDIDLEEAMCVLEIKGLKMPEIQLEESQITAEEIRNGLNRACRAISANLQYYNMAQEQIDALIGNIKIIGNSAERNYPTKPSKGESFASRYEVSETPLVNLEGKMSAGVESDKEPEEEYK